MVCPAPIKQSKAKPVAATSCESNLLAPPWLHWPWQGTSSKRRVHDPSFFWWFARYANAASTAASLACVAPFRMPVVALFLGVRDSKDDPRNAFSSPLLPDSRIESDRLADGFGSPPTSTTRDGVESDARIEELMSSGPTPPSLATSSDFSTFKISNASIESVEIPLSIRIRPPLPTPTIVQIAMSSRIAK